MRHSFVRSQALGLSGLEVDVLAEVSIDILQDLCVLRPLVEQIEMGTLTFLDFQLVLLLGNLLDFKIDVGLDVVAIGVTLDFREGLLDD